MTRADFDLELKESIESEYIENFSTFFYWSCITFRTKRFTDSTRYIYTLIYTKNLFNAFQKVEEALRSKEETYYLLLLKSILLYKFGDKKRGILIFRKAYRDRNKQQDDPFYNLSTSEKQELYKAKLSGFSLHNVTDVVLEPGFQENGLRKKRKKLKLTVQQLMQKVTVLRQSIVRGGIGKDDFKSYLNFLKKILQKVDSNLGNHKANADEILTFLLDQTHFLINFHDFNEPELFYIHGICLSNLSFQRDGYVDLLAAFKIFNIGLAVETSSHEDTRYKLVRYKESIVSLSQRFCSSAKEKSDILISGKNCIKNFTYKNNEKIEEERYLCLGDIYLELENYRESIKNYVKASDFLDSSTGNSDPYLPSKYSKKLANIFNRIDMNQMVPFLREILEEEYQKNQDIHSHNVNLFYTRMWYGIGREIYFLEKNKNKSGSVSVIGYSEAIKAYTEALEKSPQREKARIFLARGQAHIRRKDFEEAAKDLEKALDMDTASLAYFGPTQQLKPYDFRIAVRELSEIKCGKYRKKNKIHIRNFLDNIRENYRSRIRHIENNIGRIKVSENMIISCHRKLAESFYIEGEFHFHEYIYERRYSHSIKGIRKQLESSLNAYHKALKEVRHIFKVCQEKYLEPDIKYFMLEIIIKLIETGYRLNNYETTQEYLKAGSSLLHQLLEAQNEGKLKQKRYKYIQKSDLREKFDIIEEFRISFFEDEKTALIQAETRKNIFLSKLINKKGSEKYKDKIQKDTTTYKRIRSILTPNTAIVYWYVGLSEISTFILMEDRHEPINANKGKFDKSPYFDEVKYKKYERFKENIEKWNLALGNIKSHPSAAFLNEFEDLIDEFYDLLNIQSALKILHSNHKIKNIILVPHRELHRLPLHVFFVDSFNISSSYSYKISYLPSIEIGLQLDHRLIPEAGLLAIHPSNNHKTDLLSSYAESAGVYLRSMLNSYGHSKLLEGNSTETIKSVKSILRNNIDFGFLHFLGHAKHNFEDPDSSALEFSKKERLTLKYILDHLDFSNYYIVCLSACETGVTSPIGLLDEYVGLVSAFLEKGADYVVSSLWKIEDVSSSFLMLEFYRRINDIEEPLHPVLALSAAQTWLKKASKAELSRWCLQQAVELEHSLKCLFLGEDVQQNLKVAVDLLVDYSYIIQKDPRPNPFSHPYYWAGFTITGLPPHFEEA